MRGRWVGPGLEVRTLQSSSSSLRPGKLRRESPADPVGRAGSSPRNSQGEHQLFRLPAGAGETEEALGWLENTVRIGNVNYPFWSQHDEWVAALRTDSRFTALMIDVEKEWLSVVSSIDNH